MKKTFTIIAFFFATLAYGQTSRENPYQNIDDVTFLDSIDLEEIGGAYIVSNSYSGFKYELDSNMTFYKLDFDCIIRNEVDSGSWSIENHNTVVIKSQEQTLNFDVVRFDNFYFLIL